MIDKNLAIGIFAQIMVRALVIMMARDDTLYHTPPLYSLLSSFKLINLGPGGEPTKIVANVITFEM